MRIVDGGAGSIHHMAAANAMIERTMADP